MSLYLMIIFTSQGHISSLGEMENNLKLATDQWSENGSFQKKNILGILLDKDKEDKDKDKVITGSLH